jgi:hypothetical protein
MHKRIETVEQVSAPPKLCDALCCVIVEVTGVQEKLQLKKRLHEMQVGAPLLHVFHLPARV